MSLTESLELEETDRKIKKYLEICPLLAVGYYASLDDSLRKCIRSREYWTVLDKLIDDGVQGQI